MQNANDKKQINEIIFVYNADANVFALASDFAHKIVSPDTYACNLCKITYGNLRMKKQWKSFVRSLPYPVTFLHRDQWHTQYPKHADTPLPAVFVRQNGHVSQCITADQINQAKTIDELTALTKKHLPRAV